jgi:hypothetical protein
MPGMAIKHYQRKPNPKPEKGLIVARYEPRQPLDDLRKVARMADPAAEVAESALPGGTVLVVRYINHDRDRPEVEFEVVRGGQYLGYSETYGSLGETDEKELAYWYEPAAGENADAI